jgi:hypothetical protein
VFLGLCSAKGSPGVTVSGLAFTLAWPGPVILAECDPAGGELGPLGASLRRGRLAVDLWGHLVDLAPGAGTAMSRLVLPGFAEPGQARAWTDTPAPGGATGWQQLGALFTQLSGGSRQDGPDGPEGPDGDVAGAGGRFDVIADCGRLTAPDAPVAVLAAADLVLLVARPTLVSVRAAAVGLAELARHGIGPVGLVMVGDGEYAPGECARQLGTRLVAALPADPATARVLSQGGRAHSGRLLRAAAHVGSALAGTPHPPASPARHDGGQQPPGDPPLGQEHGPGPLLGRRRRGETSDVR